jgi:choline dehydrogenase-like flavoprotein
LGPTHTKTFAIETHLHPSPDWPHPTGIIQVSGQMPIWEGAPLWKRPVVRLVANRSLTCFYMTEALPTRESGVEFDGDRIVRRHLPLHNAKTFERLRSLAIKAFRRAGYPVIAVGGHNLWHEVGTARFGTDPSSSVVDPNCQVHGIRGLYVVDASVLPSAGAVNTGLTIIAVALRAGDVIAGVRQQQAAVAPS